MRERKDEEASGVAVTDIPGCDEARRASIRDEVRRFLTRHAFKASDTRYSSVSDIYKLYLSDTGHVHSRETEERFRSALGRVLRPPKAAGAWALRWAVPNLRRRRGHISIVSSSVRNVDPQVEYALGKSLLGDRLRAAAATDAATAALRRQRALKRGGSPEPAPPPPRASFRYVDEFMALSCAPDLATIRVFPNGKELAESMAAFAAVREHVRGDGGDRVLAFADRDVVLVAVGDGSTPRTAALFAFRTAWRCVSIDPALKMGADRAWRDVASLDTIRARAQDFQLLVQPHERVVLVMWHAHVSVKVALRCIGLAGGEKISRAKVALVACHCCNFDTRQQTMLGDRPDVEYEDDAIPGLMRTVRVWKFDDETRGAE